MTTVTSFIATAVLAIASLASLNVVAAKHDESKVTKSTTDTSTAMTEGEIRKIDKNTSKLTINQRELKSLAMPPMTMVFHVKEKAMLDTVKTGDKIKFKAIDDNGKLTVTEIQSRK